MSAGLLADVRLAGRSLARTPGYTLTAVGVLGVAIGAATAVFAVVDGFLLRPLPWREPERLVALHERQPAFPEMSISYPDFADWHERSRSWSGLGGYQPVSFDVGGEAGRAPEHAPGYRFSVDVLPVLGVEPALGRNFLPTEDRQGAARVVLLGHALWRRRGADPEIVGKAVRIDGEPHTVVGVLPAGFRFFRGAVDVVTPLGQLPAIQHRSRGSHPGILALGRLAPGVSLAQARAEMEEIGRALMREFPQGDLEVLPALVPAQEAFVKGFRTALLVLLGAVAFVVLIAVANVSSLTLARGLARRKELAIRAALGAGRAALVRQLLVESVVVALGGGALAVLVAAWGVDLVAAFRPASLPELVELRVSAPVLGFAVALALACGVLAGILPAASLSEPALHDVLKAGELGASAGAGGRRARTALVVAEIALAFVLLAGAALSARTLHRLQSRDPGFDPRGLLTLQLSLPPPRYDTPAKLQAFREAALARLRALPGVESAALSLGAPLAVVMGRSFDVGGRPPQPASDMPFALEFPQSPGFLETLRVPLLAGRTIDARDDARRPPVVVIDEATARRFFPGQDPIGQRIVSTGGGESWEIVGVAGHVLGEGISGKEASPYQLHVALAQMDADATAWLQEMTVVLRTSGDPLALAPAVRSALGELEPDAPVFDVASMDALVARALAPERFSAALLSGFGLFALALAAVGIFGLVSQGVARRTRELGVRMALGATPEAILRMVVAEGLRNAAAGLALGVAGAAALSRAFGHLVEGAERLDVPAALGAALVLALAATFASWLPARRATRVDPAVALRAE